ncbi:hypothetical protein SSABA_v1c05000 [Spiroplasma sabaudiense Ar-1343]|uniref:Uncharacterized protein n=1 Tax=Spiroplasma sabaudiense Ar-1343 TaxID=1276257 RepID=W6AA25_9MOLU|nr:hypothetical protein [Spiroplasma sabaudiense]AHI53907.1 hypothetical protein SSABA_v1c05000 [Spiroplasma sabaudiense Ar-1343]
MSQKFNEVIDMKVIIGEIISDDYKSLKNNDNKDFAINKNVIKEFQKISTGKEPKEYLNQLEMLFEKMAKEENFNEAMVISQFIQRYHYFYQTYVNYNNFTDPISADEISAPATTFETIFIPFFSKQIDFYFENFLEIIKESEIQKWSDDFSKELHQKINSIITESDFIKKIALVEEMVVWMQTNSFTNQITKDLEMSSEQQIFLTQINELKIVLQSLDILVERVLKKVVEVAND